MEAAFYAIQNSMGIAQQSYCVTVCPMSCRLQNAVVALPAVY